MCKADETFVLFWIFSFFIFLELFFSFVLLFYFYCAFLLAFVLFSFCYLFMLFFEQRRRRLTAKLAAYVRAGVCVRVFAGVGLSLCACVSK